MMHWNLTVDFKPHTERALDPEEARFTTVQCLWINMRHHCQVGKHECAVRSWCHITWFIDLWFSSSKFSVTACSSSEPLTALKTETYKDSVMEANWASDTYLAHYNSPPFALTLSYTAVHIPMHRHIVGLEGLQRREVGVLQQCVPIRQGHLKWIGMRGESNSLRTKTGSNSWKSN